MNQITIGNKIAEGRKAKKLSQAEIADMLNISKQAVGKWERGESMPDIIMLSSVANILGVDINYFLSDDSINLTSSMQEDKLKGRNMSFMSLKDTDFSGLDSLNGKFSFTNIERCKFVGANLSGINFKANNIDCNDFTNANFEKGKFLSVNVEKNNFNGARFFQFEFRNSNIDYNDFTNADFTDAIFKGNNFDKNIVDGAIFHEVEFNKASIKGMRFTSDMTNCSFVNCSFRKVEFSGITLKNVFFKNKIRGVVFSDCKVDKITYAFLKTANADLSGVELA